MMLTGSGNGGHASPKAIAPNCPSRYLHVVPCGSRVRSAVLPNLCAAAHRPKCAARAVEVCRGRMSEISFQWEVSLKFSTVIENVQFPKFSHGTILPLHELEWRLIGILVGLCDFKLTACALCVFCFYLCHS